MINIRFSGLKELTAKFGDAPDELDKLIGKALGHSIAMVETESKRLTPLRTGLLRSSIGGEQGFVYVRGLTAGVGTNVKYAIYVHENENSRHVIGEAKFMEKGARNSLDFVEKTFQTAISELAQFITK